MKLWLISQTEIDEYDTFDSAVVAAETEEAARNTHPMGDGRGLECNKYPSWATHADNVCAEYLGETNRKAGVVCASFNAG